LLITTAAVSTFFLTPSSPELQSQQQPPHSSSQFSPLKRKFHHGWFLHAVPGE
jgi:hypothetical protein